MTSHKLCEIRTNHSFLSGLYSGRKVPKQQIAKLKKTSAASHCRAIFHSIGLCYILVGVNKQSRHAVNHSFNFFMKYWVFYVFDQFDHVFPTCSGEIGKKYFVLREHALLLFIDENILNHIPQTWDLLLIIEWPKLYFCLDSSGPPLYKPQRSKTLVFCFSDSPSDVVEITAAC